MYKTLWSLYSGGDGDKCKNSINTYVFYIIRNKTISALGNIIERIQGD